MQHLVSQVLFKWSINIIRIMLITSNGGANMHYVVQKALRVTWLYYAAYVINRALCLELNLEEVSPIIKKMKSIIGFLKSSPKITHILG